MLEMVLYVFEDKNCDKNIVIQSTEDEVICINTNEDKLAFFRENYDLFEYICEHVDFEQGKICVNEAIKEYHIESVKQNLNYLDNETVFHLLNDVIYE